MKYITITEKSGIRLFGAKKKFNKAKISEGLDKKNM